MSIVTVENVSHSFGGRQILENVSFRLLSGEHVGLVGANGEGKSTFLNTTDGKAGSGGRACCLVPQNHTRLSGSAYGSGEGKVDSPSIAGCIFPSV